MKKIFHEEYKKNFLKAGSIAREVRIFGKSLIKPGASYNAVISQIRQKIVELGGIPAFPPQIAPNQIAAHYLPLPGEDIIFSEEVLKLDIGVCYKGAIGDCAVTIDLSGKYQSLINAVEDALLSAEKILRVGIPVREIGKIIEKTICSHGFKPIRNLSGHGLAPYKIHTDPSIPNYDDGSNAIITPGMTFAIEPFATNGKGLIYESGTATIFSFIKEKTVSSKAAQTLLSQIKTFQGLPFALHDLVEISPFTQDTVLGIQELLHRHIIEEYRPLIEAKQGIVAQAENSILVDLDGSIFISSR